MPASIASIAAALVYAGGTKTTDTSAPVFSMASATLPNTGTEPSAKTADSPALRGLTPPTTSVPESSIRWVCFMPSEPVMPWTMTLELSVRKIAICVSLALSVRRVGELGGPVGRSVHGVHERDQRVVRALEDPPALLDVVAVEAYDERLVRLVTEPLQRTDDAVGDLVAGGDAAEDVDEDRLDLRVVQDDVETVRHHLGRGAAADVEEVRGLHAAVLLTGVRHDVEGGHDQPGAVADDADRPVQLDVVEALLLGRELEGIVVLGDLEADVVLVAEVGVVVERHLAVECLERAVAELHQRVDLDQGGVLLDEDGPQLLDRLGRLVGDGGVEAGRGHDLGGLGVVDADLRVDGDAGDRVGVLVRGDLDLHTALGGGDAEVVAVGAVDEEGEVVLLRDVGRRCDQRPVDRVALDVHAEDLARLRDGVLWVLGQLDAAGLAAASGLDLGLDDHAATPTRTLGLGRGLRLLGCGDHGADRDRDAVLGEELLRLVLHQIHDPPTSRSRDAWHPSPAPRDPAKPGRGDLGHTATVIRSATVRLSYRGGMTKVVYFTACTLDGFIADEHDSLDWLFEVPHSEDDGSWDAFIGRIGPMVTGTTTYRWMLDRHFTEHPEQFAEFYDDRPLWVFTHQHLPGVPGADVRFVSGDVTPVYNELVADGRDVWVIGGGDLVGQFDDAGLLDEVHLGMTPVTLGAGRPLLPRRITSSRLRFREAQQSGQRVRIVLDVERRAPAQD